MLHKRDKIPKQKGLWLIWLEKRKHWHIIPEKDDEKHSGSSAGFSSRRTDWICKGTAWSVRYSRDTRSRRLVSKRQRKCISFSIREESDETITYEAHVCVCTLDPFVDKRETTQTAERSSLQESNSHKWRMQMENRRHITSAWLRNQQRQICHEKFETGIPVNNESTPRIRLNWRKMNSRLDYKHTEQNGSLINHRQLCRARIVQEWTNRPTCARWPEVMNRQSRWQVTRFRGSRYQKTTDRESRYWYQYINVCQRQSQKLKKISSISFIDQWMNSKKVQSWRTSWPWMKKKDTDWSNAHHQDQHIRPR